MMFFFLGKSGRGMGEEIEVVVVNGEKSDLWSDVWIGAAPLKSILMGFIG